MFFFIFVFENNFLTGLFYIQQLFMINSKNKLMHLHIKHLLKHLFFEKFNYRGLALNSDYR